MSSCSIFYGIPDDAHSQNPAYHICFLPIVYPFHAADRKLTVQRWLQPLRHLRRLTPNREDFQCSLTTMSTFYYILHHSIHLIFSSDLVTFLITTYSFAFLIQSFVIYIISMSHAIFLSHVNHECILTCSPFNL